MSVNRLLSTLNERRKPPMSNNYRELTGREKQRIKKLVTSLCANYDKEYGCLPLDCDCPMLGICFTNSALCRYFRKSVLPEDAGLEAVFTQTPTTHCKQCGKPFPTDGKRVYCLPKKLAVSRPQHGCVSTGKNSNRCNAFALGKPCAARLFEGISALAGC